MLDDEAFPIVVEGQAIELDETLQRAAEILVHDPDRPTDAGASRDIMNCAIVSLSTGMGYRRGSRGRPCEIHSLASGATAQAPTCPRMKDQLVEPNGVLRQGCWPQDWMTVNVVPHLPGSANSPSASRRSEASSSSLSLSSSRDSSATLN
jgi:hypothetical protein